MRDEALLRRENPDMKTIMIMSKEGKPGAGFHKELNSSGYAVATGTVEQCISFLMLDRVDLVILDCQDVGKYGTYYLQAIKLSAPRVPVIVLTCSYSLEKYLTARSLGAFDYLYKPFAEQEIIRVIEAATGTGLRGKPAAAAAVDVARTAKPGSSETFSRKFRDAQAA